MPSPTPSLTLYQLNGTCAFAAHALPHELSLHFTRIRMTRSSSGLFTSADETFSHEWYKQNIHHMGLVPALVVDGKTLTESPAVLTYIASLRPERGMLGRSDWEKAKVLEWMAWLSGVLHGQGVGGYLRPFRFTGEEGAYEGVERKALEKVLRCLERIEEMFEGEHAVGEGVTVVDFFLHVIWRWMGNLQLEKGRFARFARFAVVVRNVERLEGVRRALVDEELGLQFPEEEGKEKATI